jgi:hypothetical protein
MSLVLIALTLVHPGELVSGPQPGKKFGPYTFLIATGPNRGTSHCYVCETGADPAVIVLARSRPEALGQFLQQLDGDFFKFQSAKLHAWVTLVGLSQPEEEGEVVGWSKKLGLRHIPLGIYEDPLGPPGYQLNREAEITILLVKKNKVMSNFAFRKQELTSAEVKKVLEAIASLAK